MAKGQDIAYVIVGVGIVGAVGYLVWKLGGGIEKVGSGTGDIVGGVGDLSKGTAESLNTATKGLADAIKTLSLSTGNAGSNIINKGGELGGNVLDVGNVLAKGGQSVASNISGTLIGATGEVNSILGGVRTFTNNIGSGIVKLSEANTWSKENLKSKFINTFGI